MGSDVEYRALIPLDGFDVVAIPGEGVWIVDGAGNGWHVGGPAGDMQDDNALAQAYRAACRGSD